MADKIKIPYPILLIITGIIVGCIPGFEYISLNPEIIFLLFIPPLLFDASVKIDYKNFIKNFPTISFMGVTLVLFSMAGIAVVAYYLIPSMTRPLAFLLGAILSPPDAVISTGITKENDLSQRSRAILEGESLINDATALTAFRFILAVIAGGNFVFWKIGLQGF
jgi:CPA1 family monovalent cation:H+ antiporter